jgi:hypothetical protein
MDTTDAPALARVTHEFRGTHGSDVLQKSQEVSLEKGEYQKTLIQKDDQAATDRALLRERDCNRTAEGGVQPLHTTMAAWLCRDPTALRVALRHSIPNRH